MKRILFLLPLLTAALFCACSSDIPEEPITGCIAGSVSDRTTGEPVATVNVSINPCSSSTVTGNDGTFTFRNLDEGIYTLTITKEGYKQDSSTISVRVGEPTSAHLLIERIPAVVTADREMLDFGGNASTNTLSFNIVNPSYVDLEWEIEERCDWVTEVKPAKGTLKYGKTEAIVVVIDRELLGSGPNEAVIVVRSSNGSSDLRVAAIGAERYAPELNVIPVTNVTSSTATLNGIITNPGMPSYTERGFFYSIAKINVNNVDNEPNITKVSCPVTDDANFSDSIVNLKMGQTYYARAYAINRDCRVISTNEVSFTPSETIPSVSIQQVSDLNVSRRSATLNGTVSYVGDPVYTEKGFVSPSPSIYDNKIEVEGHAGGIYSAPINNIELNKIFYVRAYIKSDTTYYSTETVNFILATEAPASEMVSITDVSYSARRAKFTGRITDAGKPAYTKRGFVYGFNSNPTIENDRSAVVTGNGVDEFSINVLDLITGQKYFARVFTEQDGKYFYSGKEIDFTLQPVAASVGGTSVSEANVNSAKLTSSIISAGDPEYTEKGFVYNTQGNPDINNIGKVLANGYGAGQFSSRMSNLQSNTTYYVRAYAVQNGNTYYGSEVSFKTSKQVPVVTTNAASNVMYTSATLNATVSSVGDPAYNRRGFYYGTSANPTSANSTTVVEENSSFGAYSKNIAELKETTTYYYRAFLLQPGETEPILGQIISFTTGHAPNVTTGGVINITCTGSNESNLNWSATLYGGLNDIGNPPYTEFGFVYGTKGQPTVNDGYSTYTSTSQYDWSGNARIFSIVVSGLTTGTHYYIRAVAKTPLGYIYGEPIEFTPAVIAPTIRTYSTQCVYVNNVGWAVAFVGVAGSLGQPAATGLGFVYGLNNNPTVGDGSSISVSYTKIEKQDDYYVYGVAVSSGLTAGKNYYVRTYAKTQLGYTYGEVLTFRTY